MATGGDRAKTLASLLFRRSEMPHFRALEDVSLEVRRGESVGIVGENGAGKSTLLKIIAGVVRPTAGIVEVQGRVGALLELGSGFHPEYTGRENIDLSGALLGMPRRELREKVASIIEFADIGEHIDEPIKHYSSGMTVRLGFAVVTALSPELLITDEVLAVGDQSFQKKCIRWLEGYLEGGGTLLLCSHSMFHVQTLCRKALWIHHGKVRMSGNSFDVAREYLSYHDEKSAPPRAVARAEGPLPKILEAWTEGGDGTANSVFPRGATFTVHGVAYEPDDRPPVVLVGIARMDGTAVFGTHSNDTDFQPGRIAQNRFGFALRLDAIPLLPAKYRLRVHALDPEGLRMCDTLETEFVVTGESRDYGVVALPHRWLPPR